MDSHAEPPRTNTSGGAAMYHGANYQATVGAVFAALALAENINRLPEEVPRTSPPVRVGAEQNRPVDDLAVWFALGPLALIQAKASIEAGDLPDVFDQMVRNVVHGRELAAGSPLQPEDRLVLAVGAASSWIRDDLRLLLARLGGLSAEDTLDLAFQGDGPVKNAYNRVAPIIREALANLGRPSDDAAVRSVLSFVRIWPVSEDELRQIAIGVLDPYVVENPEQAQGAFLVLRQHFARAGQQRTVHDTRQLRSLLNEAGIRLKAPRTVASDVMLLEDQSERTITTEASSRALLTADGPVHVGRNVTEAVVRALRDGNLVITGEAGAGKSDVLLAAAAHLRAAGERVVFLDATDPAMRDPRAALGLTGQLDVVLEQWNAGQPPAYLFIDGFDATRLGESMGALLRLVRRLRAAGSNWRIAIASREYDLLYAPELRELFPYDPAQRIPEALRDVSRFGDLAHIFVRELNDDEMEAIALRSPSLRRLLEAAPTDVKMMLRNPFNLSVAARLTVGGAETPDLSGVRNRVDLLDLWWERRLRRGATALQKERELKTVAERMIAERRLRVSTDVLAADAATNELLSEAVLVTPDQRQRQVGYTHSIIFDYVVDRLLLDGEGAMAALLGNDRDAFLFVLPSIRMRFAELWSQNRTAFYRELATLFAEGNQRRTLLMVVASIPVEQLTAANDLAPLLDSESEASAATVRFIVRALIYSRENGEILVGSTARPWAEVARAMSQRLPRFEHDTLLLTHELLRSPGATPEQLRAIAETARAGLAHQLDREPYDPRLMRMAIEAFLKSYDADPASARPLLDRLLDPERIARVGQFELEPLATYADHLHDPDALEALYAGVFADISVPEGQISLGSPSVVFSLVQDATQSVSHARWALGQRFAAFLSEHPRAAMRAFCRVIDRQASSMHSQREMAMRFGDLQLRVVQDASNVWDSDIYEHEDWHVMSGAFETRLRDGIAAGDDFFAVALDEIIRHGHALYLWRVVVRNAGASGATAQTIAPFIAQRSVLLTYELGEPVADFLATGYARLPDELKERIDVALLSMVDDETNPELVDYRVQRLSEFLTGMPLEAIRNQRLAEMRHRGGDTVTEEEGSEQRRLTLSGSSVGAMSVSRPRFSGDASLAGAPPELIEAIDGAQDILDASNGVATNRDPTLIAPTVRRIDELSRSCGDEVRKRALDMMATVIRIGLEWDALDEVERAEFLGLALQAVAVEDDDLRSLDDGEEPDDDGHISWGSPNALADGIQALWRFYRHEPDTRIQEVMRRLSAHRRHNMRYLAVREFGLVRDVDPEAVWLVAESAVAAPSIAVVSAAFDAAKMVSHLDFERWRQMVFGAYDRLAPAHIKNQFVRSLQLFVVGRALRGDADAAARLQRILDEPWADMEATKALILNLTHQFAADSPAEVRAGAVGMLTDLAERLLAHVGELERDYGTNVDAYPPEVKPNGIACLQLLSEVAERVYYGSGVMQRVTPSGPFGDTGEIDLEQFRLFQPLLEALARFRFSRTAYFVVKTLQGAVDVAPRESLLIGGTAIRSGITGGLSFDQMAEDDIRAFIVRFIDGHRGLLESDRECLAAVMDVVDAFVDAGWPRWIDVIFKLDQIYRG